MKKLTFHNQKNVVGQRVREVRLMMGISQEQLAARMQTHGVNLDQQMVSKVEQNLRIVTDYELACFAKVLHVDLAALLSDFYEHFSTTDE